MQTKLLSRYSHTEHVIPQSFGVFADNLTLNQHVCDDCNQYFGDNLEIELARDTVEGLSRFDHGVKQPNEFKSLGHRSRLTLKVSEGQFRGAIVYIEYSPNIYQLVIRPIRQIGFLHPQNNQYSYFPIDEIPHKMELEEQGFVLTIHNAVRALGLSSEQAKKILVAKNIILRSWGNAEVLDTTKDAWDVQVEGRIDAILFRAVAKIAFNYLAYWECANFARQSEFDTIRSYIREGVQTFYPLVSISERPILADESNSERRRLGHIITLNWSDDHKSIVSMVSLFNRITYSISLSRDYSGEIRNLARGNFFDIANRQILPLQAR